MNVDAFDSLLHEQIFAMFIGISNSPLIYEETVDDIETNTVLFAIHIKNQYRLLWEDRVIT